MKTAFAIDDAGKMAFSLGSAQRFLVLDEASGSSEIYPLNRSSLIAFLTQHNVSKLVCSRIGNCMQALLETNRIQVIPGISGKLNDVVSLYLNCALQPAKDFSCTENGRTCGDCPGNF